MELMLMGNILIFCIYNYRLLEDFGNLGLVLFSCDHGLFMNIFDPAIYFLSVVFVAVFTCYIELCVAYNFFSDNKLTKSKANFISNHHTSYDIGVGRRSAHTYKTLLHCATH